MKYFTKKRWAGVQDGSDGGSAASWGKALRAYREQLETLRARLPGQVFAFFDRADIHDGKLLRLDIVDGKQPADAAAGSGPGPGNHPVRVALALRDVYDKQAWTLRYRAIRRVLVDFPAKPPARYRDGDGFGAVACHELTDGGNGFLRHEILFATGATLLVEFRDVEVHSQAREQAAADA